MRSRVSEHVYLNTMWVTCELICNVATENEVPTKKLIQDCHFRSCSLQMLNMPDSQSPHTPEGKGSLWTLAVGRKEGFGNAFHVEKFVAEGDVVSSDCSDAGIAVLIAMMRGCKREFGVLDHRMPVAVDLLFSPFSFGESRDWKAPRNWPADSIISFMIQHECMLLHQSLKRLSFPKIHGKTFVIVLLNTCATTCPSFVAISLLLYTSSTVFSKL